METERGGILGATTNNLSQPYLVNGLIVTWCDHVHIWSKMSLGISCPFVYIQLQGPWSCYSQRVSGADVMVNFFSLDRWAQFIVMCVDLYHRTIWLMVALHCRIFFLKGHIKELCCVYLLYYFYTLIGKLSHLAAVIPCPVSYPRTTQPLLLSDLYNINSESFCRKRKKLGGIFEITQEVYRVHRTTPNLWQDQHICLHLSNRYNKGLSMVY